LTPVQARVVLLGLFFAMVAAVGLTFSPLASSNLLPNQPYRPEANDIALYRVEVERIRAGETYYQAAAAELPTRGYPTRSVFNWRTPLPMWLLGKLPTLEFGKALLGGFSLVLMFLAFEILAREEDNCLRRPIACALLLTGPLLPTILGDLCVLPVLWSGVFIAISLCAYGVNRPSLGVAGGLAAVFFRELALPYCVLAAALAWHNRRYRELLAWAIGLTAWLVFFGFHWMQVQSLITPDAHAHRQGWIQFGGAGFVISTIQMNTYLVLLPQWATAVYFVAAMVGFAGWNTPVAVRFGLTACLYVMAFCVVGHSFNQYWGSMIAPLFCFGVVRFPASLVDLWHAAQWHTRQTAS
jgi:hypothetical protein